MSGGTKVWTPEALAALVVKRGFRLRGAEMTRLETFTDAAFAFAVTLLVISVDDVPQSYPEFLDALKRIPAFLGCFMQLMLFWWGHHVWSRRYGLEDGWDMVLGLALVATMLVYIYPLRAILGAFFADASGGALPAPFDLTVPEVGTLFVVFGVGFTTLSGLVAAHFWRALRLTIPLALNARERLQTLGDLLGWGIVTLTGLVSTLLAATLPADLGPAAGFVYCSPALTLPLLGRWMRGKRRALYVPSDRTTGDGV
jgi:hypothetical protein